MRLRKVRDIIIYSDESIASYIPRRSESFIDHRRIQYIAKSKKVWLSIWIPEIEFFLWIVVIVIWSTELGIPLV